MKMKNFELKLLKGGKMKNKILFLIFGILVISILPRVISAAPYSINFDVRNMQGFNDGSITAADIVAALALIWLQCELQVRLLEECLLR